MKRERIVEMHTNRNLLCSMPVCTDIELLRVFRSRTEFYT